MNANYYIDQLNEELQKRVGRNSQYSLRSFARDLDVSPSWLSEVLSQKKGMSTKKAEEIARALQLSRKDSTYFILSVQAKHSRSILDREFAKKKIQGLAKNWSSQKMTFEEFHPISDWHYNAILELIEIEGCEHTDAVIGRRLGIGTRKAALAVEKLISLNLIERREGRLFALSSEYETPNDIPHDAIKRHHHQMLQKASKALDEQSVLQREFLNMTLSFDAARLKEAQKEIRKFQRLFADKFYSQQDKKDSVYQFAFQFFRLDRQGASDE